MGTPTEQNLMWQRQTAQDNTSLVVPPYGTVLNRRRQSSNTASNQTSNEMQSGHWWMMHSLHKASPGLPRSRLMTLATLNTHPAHPCWQAADVKQKCLLLTSASIPSSASKTPFDNPDKIPT